jgi:hypothetical protein
MRLALNAGQELELQNPYQKKEGNLPVSKEKRLCRSCGRTAITDKRDHNIPLDCWKCNKPMEFYQGVRK